MWCREILEDDERAGYEFWCSDNGIGMSEEFAGHAFEMFSQENKTSRTQYEGTGLGLAIAKKITERLGGTIEIKSKKNCGTTVTMTIPFKTGVQNLMQYTENVNTESTEDIPLEGLYALIAEDIINSYISGMNRHLTKPIDADKLMTALKECIRKNNIR